MSGLSNRANTKCRQAMGETGDGDTFYNILKQITTNAAGTTLTVDNSLTVTGALTQTGAAGITGALTVTGLASLNGGATIPTTKTLTVTDADALLVGGVKVPQTEPANFSLVGATPATAANWGCVFFTADAAYIVSAVTERHSTAGSDGSAVTTMLKKVPSGTAAGSGTDCLAAGINLKAVADTNQAPALNATPANYTLAAGDSLAMVLTGTPTALAGVGVTVSLKRA